MAHIGSYGPAEAAVVGLVDRIFTRISAQESCVWLGLCGKRGSDAWCRVSVPQSTFTIDARQIAQMLKQSSSRSLLLIDEFVRTPDGAAVLVQRWLTQHTRARGPQLAVRFGAHACRFVACCCAETCGHPDGMALLAATINHLTRREATEPDKSGVARGGCPRTIVCTHFREMLLRGFVNMIPRTANVQVYQMELMAEKVRRLWQRRKSSSPILWHVHSPFVWRRLRNTWRTLCRCSVWHLGFVHKATAWSVPPRRRFPQHSSQEQCRWVMVAHPAC